MKIQIIGSMKFAKKMKKLQGELKKIDHMASLPFGTEDHLNDPNFVDDLERNFEYSIENDILKESFKLVRDAECVLVVNHLRNGMSGYLGTSTLMEIGIAHFLNKKIFILNPIPHFEEARWAHEVMIMKPTIINGDLSKIK